MRKNPKFETRNPKCARSVVGSSWLLGILASWLLFSAPAFADSPFDPYSKLIDALCRSDYAAGDSIAEQIEQNYPGHPAAMLARVSVAAYRAVDITGGSEDTNVMGMLDSVARTAEEWKNKDGENEAELSFIRGCALFGQGLILSRQGKVLQGVPLVIKARGEFGQVIDLQPDFYDAYLGRGAFRFVKVVFLSKFDPFHLITDEGLARKDVDVAMTGARFSHWLAVDLLAWLGPSRHEYHLADSLCAVGLEHFPEARTFLWPLCFSLMDQHDYAKAEPVCLDLLHQYQQIPEDHGFEQLWLYDWLVKCADGLNRPDDAAAYAKSGLAVQHTKFVAEQRKDQLKRLRERVRR